MGAGDTVIINSLIDIGCPLDSENIKNLGDFSPETIFSSVAALLNLISGEESFPKSPPASVAAKYNVGINMAKKIEALGFMAGEIGYQTFLYSGSISSKELGVLLLFLIERLPLKASSSVTEEPTHLRTPKDILLESIRIKLKEQLLQSKKPPLKPKPAKPYVFIDDSIVRAVKEVLSQDEALSLTQRSYKTKGQYLFSVLKKNDLLIASERIKMPNIQLQVLPLMEEEVNENIEISITSDTPTLSTFDSPSELKMILEKEIDANTKTHEEIKGQVEKLTEVLENLKSKNDQLELVLIPQSAKKVETLKKLQILSPEEENISKLKDFIAKCLEKKQMLQRQWDEARVPVEKDLEKISQEYSECQEKEEDQISNIKNLRSEIRETKALIRHKETLLQNYENQHAEMKKGRPRSFYTQKVMAFIRKIDETSAIIRKEIERIRLLQKDINSLNAQLERAFVETDVKLFKIASEDPNMIIAYKVLQKWYENCNKVMDDIRLTGKIRRDIEDLLDKVEKEKARNFKDKISRVQNDISIITKENDDLRVSLKKIVSLKDS